MKWITIQSEKDFPEKEDNYFVKVKGIDKDNDNAEYTCGAYHHFVNTFKGKYFSSLPKNEIVIEWLDETLPLVAPVEVAGDSDVETEIKRYLQMKEKSGYGKTIADMEKFVRAGVIIQKHFGKNTAPVDVKSAEKVDDIANWDIPDSDETKNKRILLADLLEQVKLNERLIFNILYTPTPSHTILNKQLDECIDLVNRMIIGRTLKSMGK